jgi:pimeloyl-ACP methyl ester carboxylesterase
MRRILQLDVCGQRLVGTYHGPGESTACNNRVGVMLVSFGQQPRAWIGDLGTHVGDAIAAAGFQVFRFDMPGTGDSPGDLPVHLEEFWRFIQDGGHEPIAKALIRELQSRYGFNGMIVGGFCGGAVTAALAAGIAGAHVQGLVLIEPEMGLTAVTDLAKRNTENNYLSVAGFIERIDLARQRLRSPRSWLRLLSGRSDFSFWWRLIRHAVGRAFRGVTGKSLPPGTNLKLLRAWDDFLTRKRPMLVITVGSDTRRKYYNSYGFTAGTSDPSTSLTWLEIPDTTHAMLAGGAKEALPELVSRWMTKVAPLG